jgi:hypothetical protein
MIDDGPVVWKSMGLSLREIICTATIFRIAWALWVSTVFMFFICKYIKIIFF